MARSIPLWVGASDDTMPPPRVRLRILSAYEGICQITGRAITPGDPWDLDHKIALSNGGSNTEDNLWPVLSEAHKAKTASDRAEKAKVDAVAKKHAGIKGTVHTGLAGRTKAEKEEARKARVKDKLPMLAPRPMFVNVKKGAS